MFLGHSIFDFRLVELAWDNASKRTGSSNHEKPHNSNDGQVRSGPVPASGAAVMSCLQFTTGAGHRRGCARQTRPMRSRTTQAIGQQHTSPLRARCEACRRKVAVICGCGNGLARDAPEASKVSGIPAVLDWTGLLEQ